MTIENNEVLNDSTETIETQETEVEESETSETTTEESQEATEKNVETPEAKVARLRRQLQRAEKDAGIVTVKAEAKPKPAPISKESSLSTKDVIALAKADIDDDDVEEVLEYARFKKIPVSEALKSSVVKATLAEKAEMRKTAQATHTGAVKKGGAKLTGEAILAKAEKGELPTSDDGFAEIWKARKGIK